MVSKNGKLVWLDEELVKQIEAEAKPFETINGIIRRKWKLAKLRKGRPPVKNKNANAA